MKEMWAEMKNELAWFWELTGIPAWWRDHFGKAGNQDQ